LDAPERVAVVVPDEGGLVALADAAEPVAVAVDDATEDEVEAARTPLETVENFEHDDVAGAGCGGGVAGSP
jgi:hypothetical protein